MSRSSRFLGHELAAILAKLLLCLCTVVALTALSVGQETTGGIKGYVKDQSGAVIAKAQVELQSTALIVPKKAETDGAGYFYFQQLPPGTYTLTVTAANFRTYKQTAIPLAVGQLPSLEVPLEVGTMGEVVEVSGKAPIVDVTTSKVAVDIPQEVINNLPKGRSYQSLIPFAPGARQEPLQSSRVDRSRQNGFQIDGASDSENTYLVEGLDTSNIQNGGIKQNVIFEFVDQVQVKTSGTEAEFGGAMGGVVNVIQKRGSNAWHGSFVTYYNTNAFDANDQCATTAQPSVSESVVPPGQQLRCGLRYNPASTFDKSGRVDQAANYYVQKQDSYKDLQPGFEIGGPLFKNKLWLFSSYVPELNRITRQTVSTFAGNSGPHSYTRSDTVQNMLNRLDFQPFQKLHLFAGWQYGYHRIKGQLPTYPDSLEGQNNPIAGQDPTSFRPDTGSVNPSNILNFGGDWTPNSRTVVAVRYGYFYYNTEDRGLPTGIRDIYQNDLVVGTTLSPFSPPQTPVPQGPPLYIIPSGTSSFANPAGFANISANLTNLFDIFSRKGFNSDVSYTVSKWGQHNFKTGYGFNHQFNNVFQGINTARINVFWGQSYTPVTPTGATNCAAIQTQNEATYGANGDTCAGSAGYFTIMDGVTTVGTAQSYNHSVYGQDSWTVGHGLTLNYGIRFDKEDLPPYSAGNPSIHFGFGQKIAPRIGGAYDVLHNGKLKIFASYGKFYDIMKYSLPRGSFGGEYWHDCVYAMDFVDYTTIKPTSPGGHACGPDAGPSAGVNVGRFIENQNWRAPAGDPADPGVDPNIKPFSQHEYIFGTDWAISSKMGLEIRYARKRLDNAIDDMSIDDSIYYIGNPGPNTYANLLHRQLPAEASVGGPGADGPACPDCPNAPKAARNYDGIESRLTYRGSKLFGQVTYTYSRLYGNYSGLTDTDVTDASGGRHNANNNRSFDLPEMQYTTSGAVVDGPLSTDRPNVLTLNGYYPLRWLGMETTLGITQTVAQGSPKSTCFPVVDSTSACQFWGQRGTWANINRDPNTGDLVLGSVQTGARMPLFTQTDVNFGHSFHVSKTNEAMKLAFELNVSNILNQHATLSYNPNPLAQGNEFLTTPDYQTFLTGYDPLAVANFEAHLPSPNTQNRVLNSQYGLPWLFQGARTMRLAARFTF